MITHNVTQNYKCRHLTLHVISMIQILRGFGYYKKDFLSNMNIKRINIYYVLKHYLMLRKKFAVKYHNTDTTTDLCRH